MIHNILCHMDLSELKVDIVADTVKPSVFTEDILAKGIIIRELSGHPRKLMQNWRLFSGLMQRQKYDVLHLNIFQALSLVYVILAKNAGVPIRIAHSHNTRLRESRTKSLKMMLHKFSRILFSKSATALWACSEDAARFMFPASLLEKKGYRILPNGIELERFEFDVTERERIRKQLGFEEAFVIGNVGRLCKQKNQSFLLDIFAHVYAIDLSARLLLIGEGEDLAILQEKADKLSLSDAVVFYGTTMQIETLLWAMDVFVFPSTFEGLGIASIEAQAAGLPTLCSDRVPHEALASNLARQFPLSASAADWAQIILKEKSRCQRGSVVEQLIQHGFDIKQVSNEVQRTYLCQND